MNVIILSLTIAALAVNMCFIVWGPRRLLRDMKKTNGSAREPSQGERPLISIVIAARNEAKNLKQSLPLLLDQSYSPLELVICDDGSTDSSPKLLQQYAESGVPLRLLSRPVSSAPGKKKALAEAIEHASGNWLLATDGDCMPASKTWAEKMMQACKPETAIVLGYGPYTKQPGWLNRWIRFEALVTAIQYLSAAALGRPYMGVGRNLLYRKSLYTEAGGFAAHEHLAGGDDDLLINATATATNTTFCIDPDTWVYSAPKESWKAYIRQKRRHLSVGTSYKRKDQLWLGAFAASQAGSYIGIAALLLSGSALFGLSLYLIRQVVVWLRVRQLAKMLGEADLIGHLPILDAGLALYYIRFSMSALLPKSGKREW